MWDYRGLGPAKAELEQPYSLRTTLIDVLVRSSGLLKQKALFYLFVCLNYQIHVVRIAQVKFYYAK